MFLKVLCPGADVEGASPVPAQMWLVKACTCSGADRVGTSRALRSTAVECSAKLADRPTAPKLSRWTPVKRGLDAVPARPSCDTALCLRRSGSRHCSASRASSATLRSRMLCSRRGARRSRRMRLCARVPCSTSCVACRVQACAQVACYMLHSCTPARLHTCTPARVHAPTPARLTPAGIRTCHRSPSRSRAS